MNRSLKMRLALGILSSVSFPMHVVGRQADRTKQQSLIIHVYDLAGVSERDLNQATDEATRILSTAGVAPVWQFGPAEAAEAHQSDSQAGVPGSHNGRHDTRDFLVVRITRDFPARSLPDALGYSLPDAQFGVHATVFYDRIERLSRTGNAGLVILLGHALAHEIGHVLLGTTEHSAAGIMKARWGRADYQRASMGLMTFNAPEREAIRKRSVLRLSARMKE